MSPCRDVIAHASDRGLADMAVAGECGLMDALIDRGCVDEALEIALRLTPDIEANDERFNLATILAAQARAITLRGEPPEPTWVDSLEGFVRQIGNPDFMSALLSCICLRLSLAQDDLAVDLLADVERTVGVDTSPNYFAYLPAAVRALLAHGHVDDVERVLARPGGGYAYAVHALTAGRAALTEARGNPEAA